MVARILYGSTNTALVTSIVRVRMQDVSGLGKTTRIHVIQGTLQASGIAEVTTQLLFELQTQFANVKPKVHRIKMRERMKRLKRVKSLKRVKRLKRVK